MPAPATAAAQDAGGANDEENATQRFPYERVKEVALAVAAVLVALVVQLFAVLAAAPKEALRVARVALNKWRKERGMGAKEGGSQGDEEDSEAGGIGGAEGTDVPATLAAAAALALKHARVLHGRLRSVWDAASDAEKKKIAAAVVGAFGLVVLVVLVHGARISHHPVPAAHNAFKSAAAASIGSTPLKKERDPVAHVARTTRPVAGHGSHGSAHGGSAGSHRGTARGAAANAQPRRNAASPRRVPTATAPPEDDTEADGRVQAEADVDTVTVAAEEDIAAEKEEASTEDEDALGTVRDVEREDPAEEEVPGPAPSPKKRKGAPAATTSAASSKVRGGHGKPQDGGYGVPNGITVTESAQGLPAELLGALNADDVAAAGGLEQIPAAVVKPLERYDGPFVAHRGTWGVGDKLPFPRKKLRNQLTHYSLGAVTKPLRDVLPPRDEVRGSLGRGGALTCAVVGNSGSLLLYELGTTIDMHDVIIRLNAGPTQGFEAQVGSRTTLRLVNRVHLGYRGNNEESVLQHVSTPMALQQFTMLLGKARAQTAALAKGDGNATGSGLFDSQRAEATWTQTFLLDPAFHDRAFQYIDKGVLSNGMYAVVLASELCAKVTLYGFFEKWRGQVRYHYYNTEQPDAGQTTRDVREAARLRLFVNARSKSHSFGEPCMGGCDAPCTNCPTGSHCECGVFHPVPDPGFCYMSRHPRGAGAPAAGCMRECRGASDGNEQAMSFCPGGFSSFCPNIPDVYSRRCVP